MRELGEWGSDDQCSSLLGTSRASFSALYPIASNLRVHQSSSKEKQWTNQKCAWTVFERGVTHGNETAAHVYERIRRHKYNEHVKRDVNGQNSARNEVAMSTERG